VKFREIGRLEQLVFGPSAGHLYDVRFVASQTTAQFRADEDFQPLKFQNNPSYPEKVQKIHPTNIFCIGDLIPPNMSSLLPALRASLRVPALTTSSATARLRAVTTNPPAAHGRRIHSSPALYKGGKAPPSRKAINTDTAENTKLGSDSEAAKTDTAFDPKTTRPEAEHDSAGKPLDVSGANQSVSKPQGDERDVRKRGAGKETEKGGASGGKKPQKKGKY
jgi:hypothetical protein